jgi:hypothetical protein
MDFRNGEASKSRTDEPIRNPTLFEMDKLERTGRLVNSLNVKRPYSEPAFYLAQVRLPQTSGPGAFYPLGMKHK